MSTVSRRGFFNTFAQGLPKRGMVSSGLEEYKQPLDRNQVKHLLQRTTFAISPEIIDKYVGLTAGELVDILFENAKTKLSPNPPAFVNDVLYNPENQKGGDKTKYETLLSLHRGDYNWQLGEWWVGLMKNDKESILEKMVLFWHGHLTTRYGNCVSIPVTPMYNQNDLYRKNFAGSFFTLLEKLSIDGAMLVYLNGNENIAEAPNENYARELMELYSLGVGNYTEDDVKEAAKVLTGWKVKYFADDTNNPYKGYLNPDNFDKNTKKFFNEFITVDYEITQSNVYEKSVRRLINIILTKKGQVAARFMMNKLYKYFVYARPEVIDEKIINQLADDLVTAKFEFEPVLKKMLKSEHFFDSKNFGVQIKSHADVFINMIGQFNYIDMYVRNIMMSLGQELFNPPNVSGWKGYRSWVTTKTMATTSFYTQGILDFNNNTNFVEWAKRVAPSGDRDLLTSRAIEVFFGKSVSEKRFQEFATILAESPDAWKSIWNGGVNIGQRVKLLMQNVIKAPEFYLF